MKMLTLPFNLLALCRGGIRFLVRAASHPTATDTSLSKYGGEENNLGDVLQNIDSAKERMRNIFNLFGKLQLRMELSITVSRLLF